MNKLLEIMNCNKIEINVATLCVGFKLHYIVYESFRDYSLVPLLDDSVIIEIIACNLFEPKGEFDFHNICNDIWSRLGDNQKSYEVSKWLFACLKYAQNTIDDSQELLQKILKIYDDFYYPPSMEHIIYYLPWSNDYDPTRSTEEENRRKLLRELLYRFILSELEDYMDALSDAIEKETQEDLGKPNARLDWSDKYPRSDNRSIGFEVLNMLNFAWSCEPGELTTDDIPAIIEFLDTPPDKALEAWDKWEKYWASLDYPERRRKLLENAEYFSKRNSVDEQ